MVIQKNSDHENGNEDPIDAKIKLKDYSQYTMTVKEKALYIIIAGLVIFAIGVLFYHNVILSLILSLIAFFFPIIRTKQIIKKQKRDLTLQFKDMLYALSASMSAGRSLESAFGDVRKDLQIMYPNPNTPIMRETEYIIRLIETGMTVENAIEQFADRSHIEDIQSFADVIRTCKRSGGNLIEVIRSTSLIISDKIETKNEIETTITAKKFESRILALTPIFMVAVLSFMSPDYMEPVFNTVIGNIVMTIALIMFIGAFLLSEKITDIEV